MVAVVTTSLISVTSIQAILVAVYRDQVVSGSTSAPVIKFTHQTCSPQGQAQEFVVWILVLGL